MDVNVKKAFNASGAGLRVHNDLKHSDHETVTLPSTAFHYFTPEIPPCDARTASLLRMSALTGVVSLSVCVCVALLNLKCVVPAVW